MIKQTRATQLVLFVLAAMLAAAFTCTAAAFAADAGALYAQHCAVCHGDKGHGDGPSGKFLKPPPRDFAVSLKGKTDAWVSKAIQDGGAAVGESATMPPFKDLSAAEVKALADYVKQLAAGK